MEIKFYLKRPDANIETVIFARISYDGYQLKYYTAEKINPKFWNKSAHRAKQTEKFREYPEFNQRLTDTESDIKSLYRMYRNDNNGTIPNPETLRELLDKQLKKIEPEKNKLKTFFGFFDDLINQSKAGVRLHPKTGKPISPDTIKTYVTTQTHLTAFQAKQKRKIDFGTIDHDFYSDYTEYLMKTVKLDSNTIGKHIQIIKLVLNEATERGLNTNMAFKSRRFVTIREKSDSIYLQESELNELWEKDLSDNKRLETVRDLFLIGCYTGLRYSDYSVLQPGQIKDGFIKVTQTKTGDTVVIPVHKTVEQIITKYSGSLPRSLTNQKTNQYLKELGKEIESLNKTVAITYTKAGVKVIENYMKWELLTSHTARRSFASNQYLAGVPTITIMAITGHRTEKSFMRYIKLTSDEHAKLLKLHWDEKNQLKAV